MTATLRLAEQLISCASVTPDDASCQSLIADRLAPLGFVCETLVRGPADFRVTNLWAKRVGGASGDQNHAAPLLVLRRRGHQAAVFFLCSSLQEKEMGTA